MCRIIGCSAKLTRFLEANVRFEIQLEQYYMDSDDTYLITQWNRVWVFKKTKLAFHLNWKIKKVCIIIFTRTISGRKYIFLTYSFNICILQSKETNEGEQSSYSANFNIWKSIPEFWKFIQTEFREFILFPEFRKLVPYERKFLEFPEL
jgi:hypothetical protein